jgi:hypothetical protein
MAVNYPRYPSSSVKESQMSDSVTGNEHFLSIHEKNLRWIELTSVENEECDCKIIFLSFFQALWKRARALIL